MPKKLKETRTKRRRPKQGKHKTMSKRPITRRGGIPTRTSTRGQSKNDMFIKKLGYVSEAGFNSAGVRHSTPNELTDFINNQITEGPQLVDIPVPSQRHTILVDIQPDKIMVSDWGGVDNRYAGKRSEPWKTYTNLLDELERKYRRKIVYYDVDEELHNISSKKMKACSGGGCSDYIYAWVEKYYNNYRVMPQY